MPKANSVTPNGERVRDRREELELSQAQLAARVGTTQKTISIVEAGQGTTMLMLRAIAAGLDEDVQALIQQPAALASAA